MPARMVSGAGAMTGKPTIPRLHGAKVVASRGGISGKVEEEIHGFSAPSESGDTHSHSTHTSVPEASNLQPMPTPPASDHDTESPATTVGQDAGFMSRPGSEKPELPDTIDESTLPMSPGSRSSAGESLNAPYGNRDDGARDQDQLLYSPTSDTPPGQFADLRGVSTPVFDNKAGDKAPLFDHKDDGRAPVFDHNDGENGHSSSNLWYMDVYEPVGKIWGIEIQWIHIIAAVAIIMALLLCFCIYRFRRKVNPEADGCDAEEAPPLPAVSASVADMV